MRIISGGQTGVDRAALDAAIACGIAYGGWCPRGGWAEDMPSPPGLLTHYPLLRETPTADPAQRTEWNVRDADAIFFLVDAGGLSVSPGTGLGHSAAEREAKPVLTVDITTADALEQAAQWLRAQLTAQGPDLALGIGGPRESEVRGIYTRARNFIALLLEAQAVSRSGDL
jgi:hypothetical protein